MGDRSQKSDGEADHHGNPALLSFRYFADPEFCCTFYDCSNSIPTRMECTTPGGPLLYYNEVGKYCDWPENTADDCGRRRMCCPTLNGIDACWY